MEENDQNLDTFILFYNLNTVQQCSDYRFISLNSHVSKVMMKMTLSRIKQQVEEIIAEKKAEFCSGRSTIQQIFNLRFLREKSIQHQQKMLHIFVNFKKL